MRNRKNSSVAAVKQAVRRINEVRQVGRHWFVHRITGDRIAFQVLSRQVT